MRRNFYLSHTFHTIAPLQVLVFYSQ